MRVVNAYIAEKQAAFTRHPLFERLRRDEPLADVLHFIPYLSFWVMSFQDVLRMNERRVTDPRMRRIARHHRAEDAGHDVWFLNDVVAMDGAAPELRDLFGPGHAITREATYALVSEVLSAESDVERVVLLLTLESTGHIFFEATASYLERMHVTTPLSYFSRHHIDVEKRHEVFEKQMTAFLETLDLPVATRGRAMAMVDRMYDAFAAMFDGFEGIVAREKSASGAPSGARLKVRERLRECEAEVEALPAQVG